MHIVCVHEIASAGRSHTPALAFEFNEICVVLGRAASWSGRKLLAAAGNSLSQLLDETGMAVEELNELDGGPAGLDEAAFVRVEGIFADAKQGACLALREFQLRPNPAYRRW